MYLPQQAGTVNRARGQMKKKHDVNVEAEPLRNVADDIRIFFALQLLHLLGGPLYQPHPSPHDLLLLHHHIPRAIGTLTEETARLKFDAIQGCD